MGPVATTPPTAPATISVQRFPGDRPEAPRPRCRSCGGLSCSATSMVAIHVSLTPSHTETRAAPLWTNDRRRTVSRQSRSDLSSIGSRHLHELVVEPEDQQRGCPLPDEETGVSTVHELQRERPGDAGARRPQERI